MRIAIDKLINPFKALTTLQTSIPIRLLESHYAEHNPTFSGKLEVILPMYFSSFD